VRCLVVWQLAKVLWQLAKVRVFLIAPNRATSRHSAARRQAEHKCALGWLARLCCAAQPFQPSQPSTANVYRHRRCELACAKGVGWDALLLLLLCVGGGEGGGGGASTISFSLPTSSCISCSFGVSEPEVVAALFACAFDGAGIDEVAAAHTARLRFWLLVRGQAPVHVGTHPMMPRTLPFAPGRLGALDDCGREDAAALSLTSFTLEAAPPTMIRESEDRRSCTYAIHGRIPRCFMRLETNTK
jgi:hypothetical protein